MKRKKLCGSALGLVCASLALGACETPINPTGSGGASSSSTSTTTSTGGNGACVLDTAATLDTCKLK